MNPGRRPSFASKRYLCAVRLCLALVILAGALARSFSSHIASASSPPISSPATRAWSRPSASRILDEVNIPRHGDYIVVPLAVGGKRPLFVFDTGATRSLLDRSLADRLGPRLNTTVEVRTADTTLYLEAFRGPELRLRSVTFSSAEPVVKYDLRWFREVTGHEVEGILGIDRLIQHIVQIDFDDGKLRFLRSAGPEDGTPVPLHLDGLQPLVRVTFPGTTSVWSHAETFIVDTGHGGTGSLATPVFDALLKDHRGRLRTFQYRTAGLEGNFLPRRQETAGRTVLGPFEADGLHFHEGAHSLLGLGYWSRYRVTFDFPHRSLYLAEGRRFRVPDRDMLLGAWLVRKKAYVCVGEIQRGGPGERAGLQKDDQLVRIGGQMANRLSLFEVRELFSVSGQKVAVTVRRRGAERSFEVKLPAAPLP